MACEILIHERQDFSRILANNCSTTNKGLYFACINKESNIVNHPKEWGLQGESQTSLVDQPESQNIPSFAWIDKATLGYTEWKSVLHEKCRAQFGMVDMRTYPS